MPHLTILYTANLDRPAEQGGTDIQALCAVLAETMIAQRDEAGRAVFPVGGVRVLAFPASHYAVADRGAAGRAAGGTGEYAFVYLNLRMARGRSGEVHEAVGRALDQKIKRHFEPLLASSHIGITLQIDEGPEVVSWRNSSLHPLFERG
ncbi:5-carboxymethyl-2-hydroxymuconate isomerase [Burkholderia cenocepacia]|uniref:5-carboxymethyl-2-hydroxymuconate isomerase n=1 Tax=Burkholderia cenocepacia TaxID=95486 RepID=UPI002862A20F|nr:5-carboxymethyl-2-hydroxymuconate isomerase [Burkholderia cenocepacia]MDR5647526.1 5-carboxymethyl-2-hydroxymuconate Delta-isomerase [Burkholderia cenocepacia]